MELETDLGVVIMIMIRSQTGTPVFHLRSASLIREVSAGHPLFSLSRTVSLLRIAPERLTLDVNPHPPDFVVSLAL